jgi:hypothetical protein
MNTPDPTPITAPETTVSGAVSVSDNYRIPCQEVSLAGTRLLTRGDIWGAMFIPEADIPEAFCHTEFRIVEDLRTPITPAMFGEAVSALREMPEVQ